MNKQMILKVYDIDYSFIIKNYLDTKLWEKEWTLFLYKKFIVTIRLDSILVNPKKIDFRIKLTDNSSSCLVRSVEDCVCYALAVDNIDILKKKINYRILYLMETLERVLYIKETEEYCKLKEIREEEIQKLKKIAERFLDENDIVNEDIREAYIEAFIDKNEETSSLKNDYMREQKYKILPDLFFTFAEATGNKTLKEDVLSKNSNNVDEIMQRLNELEEYMKTGEYVSDMASNLEDI